MELAEKDNKKYRMFYELAGRFYPEDKLTYSSLSGLVRKKWVSRKLASMPPGNLLDCGCNIGRLAAFWDKGPVFAIDIAYSLVAKGKNLYPKINFIQGDIQHLTFIKPESIDNAIAIEVIEHLPQPEAFLTGLYKAMKKGGMVLITTPGYSRHRPVFIPLGIIKSYGIDKGPQGKHYLHTAYKPEELARLAENAQFKVIEKGSFEFELRGWVKPLVILQRFFNGLSEKLFPVSRLNHLFLQFTQTMEIDIFYILDVFYFAKFLRTLFKEGRRTFIVAIKK
ncbi:MAG: methyltransferase domain-containing protein [candidate division WOR-3 bacterium]